jgi:hypothetical protein
MAKTQIICRFANDFLDPTTATLFLSKIIYAVNNSVRPVRQGRKNLKIPQVISLAG